MTAVAFISRIAYRAEGPLQDVRRLIGFIVFVCLFVLYLVLSALTEMGTRWPWRR